jgi:hypothetical protein
MCQAVSASKCPRKKGFHLEDERTKEDRQEMSTASELVAIDFLGTLPPSKLHLEEGLFFNSNISQSGAEGDKSDNSNDSHLGEWREEK